MISANAVTIPRFLLKAILILSLASYLASEGSAQSVVPDTDEYGRWIHGAGEPLSFEESVDKHEIERLKARWLAINRENENVVGDSPAGTYGNGDETHGSLLRWSPLAGFVLLYVDKCAARIMGFSHGSVIMTPTKLELIPEGQFTRNSSHLHSHAHAYPNQFLFVKWRNVTYLTEKNDIRDLLDSMAGLGKYNESSYWNTPGYAKWGSREIGTADDPPLVSPGYERFVKRPINLTITGVGRRVVHRLRVDYDTEPQYESRTPVTISGGSAKGVKVGMKFRVLDSAESDEVMVRSVGRRASDGVIIRWIDPDPKTHFSSWPDYERYPPIKVGWRLSTSLYKLLESTEAKGN